MYLGPIEKKKTRLLPRPLIYLDIFDFSLEAAKRNSTKLDRKQDLNTPYQVCVFRADRKIKMTARPLIGRDIFDFSKTAEWISTKLDLKQDFNVVYQVCVFPIGKPRWPPLCLIGWDIFRLPEMSESFLTCLSFGLILKILSVYSPNNKICSRNINFLSVRMKILRSDTFRHHWTSPLNP